MTPEELQVSLADPAGASFLAAANWVQDTLLGSLAVGLGAIAIASIGFAMLSGRIDVRRGLIIVLGCFILFGAKTIVAGLVGSVNRSDVTAPPISSPVPVFAGANASAALPPSTPSTPYDPYAGASVAR